MSKQPLRVRAAFVDGTWSKPEDHNTHKGNVSNIYRMFVATQEGDCQRRSGDKTRQDKQYWPGVESSNKKSSPANQCQERIKQVYEYCCKDESDEVWLFGFSYGAYVVRAVATLLHQISALESAGTPQFDTDFEEALLAYKGQQAGRKPSLHSSDAKVRCPPRIRFVGVFDTVMPSSKPAVDLSVNDSIMCARQALASNEDNKPFKPFSLLSDTRQPEQAKQTIEAWFIGAHSDMGGANPRDGLSLYPSQWMLTEADARGLILKSKGTPAAWGHLDYLMQSVFPGSETKTAGDGPRLVKAANGMRFTMYDIREVYTRPGLEERYTVKMNFNRRAWTPKSPRQPFVRSESAGYRKNGAYGRTSHPSIYLLSDTYPFLEEAVHDSPDEVQSYNYRKSILPRDEEVYWFRDDPQDEEDPGAVRILVCGDTGVGKSTSINLIFGEESTKTEANTRGKHDINKAFTSPKQPGSLIHDSCGFETGSEEEFHVVNTFLRTRGAEAKSSERLHAIWFCLNTDTSRPLQKAGQKLFQAISEHSATVPVIVVGTKKAKFIHEKAGEFETRRPLEQASNLLQWKEERDRYTNEQLRLQQMSIEEVSSSIPGLSIEDMHYVDRDDMKSIEELAGITYKCFDNSKVRLHYVSAQVVRIDSKVKAAVRERMRSYKHAIRTATISGLIPSAQTATSWAVTDRLMKGIVKCFGLPYEAGEIEKIMSDVLKEKRTIGGVASSAFVETMAAASTVGYATILFAPFSLVTGAAGAQVAVPLMASRISSLGVDTIIVSNHAYKENAGANHPVPDLAEIDRSSQWYYKGSSRVNHAKVQSIINKKRIWKNFSYSRVEARLIQIINHPDDPVKIDKLDKSGKLDKRRKSDKQKKSDKPGMPYRPETPKTSDKPVKPVKPVKVGRGKTMLNSEGISEGDLLNASVSAASGVSTATGSSGAAPDGDSKNGDDADTASSITLADDDSDDSDDADTNDYEKTNSDDDIGSDDST